MINREDFIKWATVNYSVDYILTYMDELLEKYMEEIDYVDNSSRKSEIECIK